jgi:RNA polymerase sigma-70 factor, ECF subfamily
VTGGRRRGGPAGREPAGSGRVGGPGGAEGSASPEGFAELRPLLFSIAYRMTSSVGDAEDLVQEAFVRYDGALASGAEVRSPKAYLSAVVTRLAIDHVRSARVRRESYVGQWLPEPLLTDEGRPGPADHAEQADTLSMAFLLLLERLGPVERAVFLLHDVFGYGYDEVSAIVGKSEANCRQVARRARQHLEAGRPRFDTDRRRRDELADRFFAAMGEGDVDGLVDMLAADAAVYGDGGGKAPQWAKPVVGAGRVAHLLVGVGRDAGRFGLTFERHDVNGQPGVVVLHAGEVVSVFTLDIADGVVQNFRSVINPDKLVHIGPVADLQAIRERARGQ